MTRIIAGVAGSLVLSVPGTGTRPTSDRVRESLFGSLEAADALTGARVLDLYAGSGALGLEAASRGAARVDLVEKAPRAAAICAQNARRVSASLGGDAGIRTHRQSVESFLRASADTWDLVFVDPPYELDPSELAATLELLTARLAAHAQVIVERASRSGAPTLPASLTIGREKRYGDTTLWWLQG